MNISPPSFRISHFRNGPLTTRTWWQRWARWPWRCWRETRVCLLKTTWRSTAWNWRRWQCTPAWSLSSLLHLQMGEGRSALYTTLSRYNSLHLTEFDARWLFFLECACWRRERFSLLTLNLTHVGVIIILWQPKYTENEPSTVVIMRHYLSSS